MKTTIAIDPGTSGGIAWRTEDQVMSEAMPDTQGDILDLIRTIKVSGGECTAHLEDLPKFTGKKIPGSRVAVMFENFGFLKGVLQTLGISLVLVKPAEWQKFYSLGTARGCKTESMSVSKAKTIWKNKLKSEAQRLYPSMKVTLATSDALLILNRAFKRQNEPSF